MRYHFEKLVVRNLRVKIDLKSDVWFKSMAFQKFKIEFNSGTGCGHVHTQLGGTESNWWKETREGRGTTYRGGGRTNGGMCFLSTYHMVV